jgi:hypothetical protein
MLVAMTYSTPLFVCTVTGLVIGHAYFNSEAPSADSATPCCEGVQYAPSSSPEETKPSSRSPLSKRPVALNGTVPDCCAHIDLDALGL